MERLAIGLVAITWWAQAEILQENPRNASRPSNITTTTTNSPIIGSHQAVNPVPHPTSECAYPVPDVFGRDVPFSKFKKGKQSQHTYKTCVEKGYNIDEPLFGIIRCDTAGLDYFELNFRGGAATWNYKYDASNSNVILTKKTPEIGSPQIRLVGMLPELTTDIYISYADTAIWTCSASLKTSLDLRYYVESITVKPLEGQYAYCVWKPERPLGQKKTGDAKHLSETDVKNCINGSPPFIARTWFGGGGGGLYYGKGSMGHYPLVPENNLLSVVAGSHRRYLPSKVDKIQCNLEGLVKFQLVGQDDMSSYLLQFDNKSLSLQLWYKTENATHQYDEFIPIWNRVVKPSDKSFIIDFTPKKFGYCSKETEKYSDLFLATVPMTNIETTGIANCKYDFFPKIQRQYVTDISNAVWSEREACKKAEMTQKLLGQDGIRFSETELRAI